MSAPSVTQGNATRPAGPDRGDGAALTSNKVPSYAHGSVPNGYGVYTWPDGSRYEGDWLNGVKNGRGKYYWPSGAVYEGEWNAGRMHGQGTYSAKDGTRYQGSWTADLKNGLGHKRFPNGDQYQGLWRNGQPNGPGMYKARRSHGCAVSLPPYPYARSGAQWANGNEFNGEWVTGLMCGRGTFVWSTGERYDGEWRDGKEEGRGTFTWPDGSYFDGNWVGGEKHGVGIWAPPVAPADATAPGAPRDAVLREYDRGSLVREELVPAQQRPVGDPVAGRPAVKTRKVREVRMGETIFKGAPSYDLMLQLQLGVRWSVGRITPERPRDLSDQDYASSSPLARVSARFPRRGSSTTPPHASHDFKWKDYCPMVFRKLRERFGIDAGEYMLSLCGDMALRELSSPGKSGSVFFLSQDGRFIVKTMRKAEMTHLCRAVLRDYYAHVIKYPDTMLTRFFGLHRVKPHGGRNVRFVVMGNLLCTGHAIHRRYDLKGSTFGRLTRAPYDPAKKILKDLDLDYTYQLDEGYAARLAAQLSADCKLLEQLNIMDYSLLLGVHIQQKPARPSAGVSSGKSGRLEGRKSKPDGGDDDDDDDDDFDGETNTHLGENMSAVAIPGRVLPAPRDLIQGPLPTERLSVILNFGIIDILQEYNIVKQVEHSWKTVVQRQHNISSVDPTAYAARFLDFMSGIFL